MEVLLDGLPSNDGSLSTLEYLLTVKKSEAAAPFQEAAARVMNTSSSWQHPAANVYYTRNTRSFAAAAPAT